ncbi:SDR family NAD(P)-dependent oxidoreductase [Streptomyces sp. DG2A-72]|uniref:SDR family NAD(P)-dependent oxidoreductase n=1 Tax=Streptomyces sp. DG2A-72 TaxID=3051386 RepID=UPI00265C8A57|nr:SDR family NAD(P)-dependent oxidoreductase [Streptomyces sp. DG2A-72]MDO0938291.1 SDR family NAD(P)-dependent oxidoreductase [Streptomyces sp. DG2A-72]
MTTPLPVLITGCSSGIGRACALRMHRAGLTVYATARRPETLTGLAAEGIRTLRLDVTDEASMRAVVDLGHALWYGSPVISLRPLQDVMVRLTARDRTVTGSPPATPLTSATDTTAEGDADTYAAKDASSARTEGCPAHRSPGSDTR